MKAILTPTFMIPNKTIFDLFNIQPENIDRAVKVLDNQYSDQEVSTVLFRQTKASMLIFDKVEVEKLNENNKKRVLLKRKDSKSVLYELKNIFDKLYELYGIDDLSRKKFALNDLLDLHHGEEISRHWENVIYPVRITFTKGRTIELIIHLN
ncbi:MAG TPA: hypothetical protein EYN16_10660 [Flavobacteriaceae bacterium]|nr:hypothetical protein [Flavobacteriaceae bacterium]